MKEIFFIFWFWIFWAQLSLFDGQISKMVLSSIMNIWWPNWFRFSQLNYHYLMAKLVWILSNICFGAITIFSDFLNKLNQSVITTFLPPQSKCQIFKNWKVFKTGQNKKLALVGLNSFWVFFYTWFGLSFQSPAILQSLYLYVHRRCLP